MAAPRSSASRRARKTVPMLEATRKRTRPGPKPPPTRPTAKPVSRRAAASAKPARASTHPVKERSPATLAVIDRVREACLGLPDTTEVLAWGEPTWRVAGRLFAMFDTHHHGNPHLSVWIPAAPGAQAGLIEADPARFWRPPYVGGKGWVAIVVDDPAPPWEMIASLIAQAHRLIAPLPKPRRGASRDR
ncbi:MAG TPA: MmcQ/YjbR family DNA-binding protein [Kofleriaceae bacterium]|nr:MmcQ/YjbR family DNA-binding protein [Kofleriaceae bacterium]